MSARRGRLSTVVAAIAVLGAAAACAPGGADLAVRDCAVLDVRTGAVTPHRTVFIRHGMITGVRDATASVAGAARVVEADGRLLVPGFIDAHGHTEYVLGDSITAGGGFLMRLTMAPDSIAAYRARFAGAYLPYGITTVRDVGSPEEDMPMLLAWMAPSPDAPDFHPVGGALVSEEEGRTPSPHHAVVRDSADAVRKVREYHDLGIRHVKLYWRLREPELRAALAEAKALGMRATGHIDYQVVPLATAIDLGLTSFEHSYTFGVGAMTEDEFVGAWGEARRRLGAREDGLFYFGVMEYFNTLGPDHPKVMALIDRVGAAHGMVVPTLHIFAQRFGLTAFSTPSVGPFDRTDGLTEAQQARAVAGYRILAGYVRQMHERGIRLAVGSDWRDPGKACLSEMLLLHDLGLPMPEVIRIASLNGAEALGVEDSVGTVEPGKRANLVLLDPRVLEEPDRLFGDRLVIKDGRVWEGVTPQAPPRGATS